MMNHQSSSDSEHKIPVCTYSVLCGARYPKLRQQIEANGATPKVPANV